VFGLDIDHIKHLKGTKSKFLLYDKYNEAKLEAVANKWEKEASQKDRIYILSGEYPYGSNTVYYVEESGSGSIQASSFMTAYHLQQ
jgi:hypothetical protein